MKQARLEALKLAQNHGLAPEETLKLAEDYFRYIEEGAKVVELSRRNRRQRRKPQE
jgi:hypothetical protein